MQQQQLVDVGTPCADLVDVGVGIVCAFTALSALTAPLFLHTLHVQSGQQACKAGFW